MITKDQLRYGVFLPPFHPLDEDPSLCIQRDFELAEHLDHLGYDEMWIGEHHSGGFEIIASPELFIAGAAERTRTIRLGTGVMSLPYHNPMTVAGRIAQLDHQTKGRAMFGFGPGLLNSDAHMLGIGADRQRDRLGEALDVIVRLLDGEVVTAETDWFTLRDAHIQFGHYKGRRPHLAVTSTVTPNGGVLAGRHGLGMLCVAAASDAGYSALDTNWEIACQTAERAGKVMDRYDFRLTSIFHVAETREQALQEVRWGFEKWEAYTHRVSTAGPASAGIPSLEQAIANRNAIIGTPDDAVAQLERYWQKTGGFGALLILAHNWATFEATKRSYELIARHVMPAFAGRNARRTASYDWMGDNCHAFTEARAEAARMAIEKHKAAQAVANG